MKNKCENCALYTPYYVFLGNKFMKLNYGACSDSCKLKPQKAHKICNSYINNAAKHAKREEYFLDNLEQAVKSINEIAAVLEEKYDRQRFC